MNNKLINALDELNSNLKARRQSIELIVCGAFAIELHGFKRRDETHDIDTHSNLDDVQELINKVASDLGLENNWLNNQVSDIQLPKNAHSRLKTVSTWSHIEVKYLSVEDLIQMKIGAWLNRGHITEKDYTDLVVMKATKNQIQQGIEFVIESHKIMELPEPFKKDSLDLLQELEKNFSE
jgi:hypothetical protein